jgi:hypothetical protein
MSATLKRLRKNLGGLRTLNPNLQLYSGFAAKAFIRSQEIANYFRNEFADAELSE